MKYLAAETFKAGTVAVWTFKAEIAGDEIAMEELKRVAPICNFEYRVQK